MLKKILRGLYFTWPNIVIYVAWLHESQGSDGDPECIFFTLNTYQATFISDLICDTTAGIGNSEVGNDAAVWTDRPEG